MTATAVVSTFGVLLALLLISAVWVGRKPRWQIVFGPPEESGNRIPLTEFYGEARNRGWDFDRDRQLFLDLAIGLREAALAGAIEIWGRKCRVMTLRRASDEPLLRIPAVFWKHHGIDGLRMAIATDEAMGADASWGMETNNALIHTHAMPTNDPDFDDTTYGDLHLNYLQAMDWLQTDAGRYKGVSRAVIREQPPGA